VLLLVDAAKGIEAARNGRGGVKALQEYHSGLAGGRAG
jgi:hypothetical protein